jgi:hypothetical protein
MIQSCFNMDTFKGFELNPCCFLGKGYRIDAVFEFEGSIIKKSLGTLDGDEQKEMFMLCQKLYKGES